MATLEVTEAHLRDGMLSVFFRSEQTQGDVDDACGPHSPTPAQGPDP